MARRSPKTDEQRVEFIPLYRPFTGKIPIPGPGICEPPGQSMCINYQWMPIIRGLLHTLDQPDIWDSDDDDDIFAVRQQVRELVAMKGCVCGYPPGLQITNITVNTILNLQYVEIFEEGGLDAVAPDRPDTSFSEDTGDTGNEISRRRVALCLATKDYVSTVIQQGIFNAFIPDAVTLLTAGAISFFLGPLGGLVYKLSSDIMEALINKVAESPEIIELVSCCMFEALEGEDITEANFEASLDNCGFGLLSDEAFAMDAVASGLDDQGNFLTFVAHLSAFFENTDDDTQCACPAEEGCLSDWTIDEGGWTPFQARALYVEDTGWDNSPSGGLNHFITIEWTHDADFDVAEVRVNIDTDEDDDIQWNFLIQDEFGATVDVFGIILPGSQSEYTFSMTTAGDARKLIFGLVKQGLQLNIDAIVTRLEIIEGDCVLPTQPVE